VISSKVMRWPERKSTREARKDYFAPFARLGAGLGRVV
jgi:hypothetical protein